MKQAVNYHFGSKQALVEAALDHRMDEVIRRRRAMLEALDRSPSPTPVAVAEALVAPLADMSLEHESRHYVGFILRLLDGGYRELLGSHAAAQVGGLARNLTRAVSGLSLDEAILRFALASEIFIPALAGRFEPTPGWRRLDGPGRRETVVASVAAIFAMAPTPAGAG